MRSRAGRLNGMLPGVLFVAVTGGVLAIGAWIAFGQVRDGYEEQLQRRLASYAATAAAGLSHRMLSRLTEDDHELAALVHRRLNALQEASGVRRAAVLHRSGTVVVDGGGRPFGSRDYGFATDANELERCFAEGSLVTIAYRDAGGTLYRNGFAPVTDPDGGAGEFAVAVELEADYVQRLSTVRNALLATVLVVFGATLGAAFVVSRVWRQMHADLERQRRLAEQAQFSAGMAHQIKNPLAALRGWVELLARGLTDPGQREMADRLMAEIGALDRVVRDFLQFSRGAHGSHERLSLESALRPVLESARAAGGPKVSVISDAPAIELELDSTALREALTNLAVNAAESLKETGGTVAIRATPGALVTVDVEDTGPGIPDEVHERLFEPFVTGKADGTGLGLPIARRLLRDLGGDLELIRTGPGGTVFRATFRREMP
jgi:signal transduction histidine kinase